MRDTTYTTAKGNEMATKLIGLVLVLVIGTIVATNLIHAISDVTESLQNGIVLIHVDGN